MDMMDIGRQDIGANKRAVRDQLLHELRFAYENGASIRTLVASTGKSYGAIHSLLRESGTVMRGRGGPNHRTKRVG